MPLQAADWKLETRNERTILGAPQVLHKTKKRRIQSLFIFHHIVGGDNRSSGVCANGVPARRPYVSNSICSYCQLIMQDSSEEIPGLKA